MFVYFSSGHQNIMPKFYATLVAFFFFVPLTRAGTPTWAHVQNIINSKDTAPEFQNFISQYGLTKRHAESFDARKVPPFFYSDGSALSVFLTWEGSISELLLTPKPGFDPAVCFPLPEGAAPTKETILGSLGLSDAPGDDRGDGAKGYNSSSLGVVVIFRGDQLQLVCFYPPKKPLSH